MLARRGLLILIALLAGALLYRQATLPKVETAGTASPKIGEHGQAADESVSLEGAAAEKVAVRSGVAHGSADLGGEGTLVLGLEVLPRPGEGSTPSEPSDLNGRLTLRAESGDAPLLTFGVSGGEAELDCEKLRTRLGLVGQGDEAPRLTPISFLSSRGDLLIAAEGDSPLRLEPGRQTVSVAEQGPWRVTIQSSSGRPFREEDLEVRLQAKSVTMELKRSAPPSLALPLEVRVVGQAVELPPPSDERAVFWFKLPGHGWGSATWARRGEFGQTLTLFEEAKIRLVTDEDDCGTEQAVGLHLVGHAAGTQPFAVVDLQACDQEWTPAPAGTYHVGLREDDGSWLGLLPEPLELEPGEERILSTDWASRSADLSVLFTGDAPREERSYDLYRMNVTTPMAGRRRMGDRRRSLTAGADGVRVRWSDLPPDFYAIQLDGQAVYLADLRSVGVSVVELEYRVEESALRYVHLTQREDSLGAGGSVPTYLKVSVISQWEGRLPAAPYPKHQEVELSGRLASFGAPNGSTARLSVMENGELDSYELLVGSSSSLEAQPKPRVRIDCEAQMRQLPLSWVLDVRAFDQQGPVDRDRIRYTFSDVGFLTSISIDTDGLSSIDLPASAGSRDLGRTLLEAIGPGAYKLSELTEGSGW